MSEIIIPHIESPYSFEAYAHVVEPTQKPTRHGETAEPMRLMQRLPRSLHASLVARAKAEGTSLNTLVTMLLAEGIGRREHHV